MRWGILSLLACAIALSFEESGQAQGTESQSGSKPVIHLDIRSAPTIAGNDPFSLGDNVSDFSSTQIKLSTEIPVGAGGVVSLSGGLSFDTDLDGNSSSEGGSSFFGEARFDWKRGFRRLTPFASYRLDRGFDARLPELISVKEYLDHSVTAGVSFQTNRWCFSDTVVQQGCLEPEPSEAASIRISASIERRWSDVPDRERITPQLRVDVEGKFVAKIEWTLSASGEIRWFDEVSGVERTDVRGVAFAGLNFARAIGRSWLRELKLGVQWVEVDSTDPNKDVSEWNILPVLTLRFSFN